MTDRISPNCWNWQITAASWGGGLKLLLAAGSVAVLAGCAAGGPGPGSSAGQNSSGNQQAINGQTKAQGKSNQTVVRGLRGVPKKDLSKFKNPNNPLSKRTIHFAFNSSSIPSRYAKIIRAHAHYLSKHPNVHVRLEGHTDKRGTREYNIALGSRRAKSVKQAMVLAGAKASQISTLSFGEERPAVVGDTKADYAKNRRVVIIYTKH